MASWLPFNILIFSLWFSATPTLSESGSVAISISPFSFINFFIPKSRASISSGFGECTVENSGSGNSWLLTLMIFLNPNAFNAWGIWVIPVPWREEKIIFNLDF